ncbi:uncharacterized protein LOC112434910 isoform X1 [Maylandia zebra]|uniref:uncharacterized protein LOC112434910 isoform X1 n=1 Tax=Maylandia zebra TaxID=106582 RepID=UPI00403CBAA8
MTPLASSVSPKRELFKGKRLTNSKTISTPPLPDCRGSFEFRSAKMAAANPGGSPPPSFFQVEKTRHLLGEAAPVGTAPTTKSLSESLSPSVSSGTLSTSTSASSQISSTTFESVRRSWPPSACAF